MIGRSMGFPDAQPTFVRRRNGSSRAGLSIGSLNRARNQDPHPNRGLIPERGASGWGTSPETIHQEQMIIVQEGRGMNDYLGETYLGG